MKTKRILSLLLAGAMVLSSAACGGSSDSGQSSADGEAAEGEALEGYATEIDMEEEPYTVAIQVVTLPGSQFEGEEDREAAINAITEPAINCKVDIQEIWISEIANTTSMAVAGDEKIDLVHVATVSPLSSMVGSDLLLDMNEGNLLANRGQDIVELFGDELIATGNVGGMQLAVPAKTYNATAKGIVYNKTLADEAGIEIPEKITMEELSDILYQVKEAYPDIMPYYIGNGELNLLFWLQSYETFGSESSYGVVFDTDAMIVENLYASDMFKEYCLMTYHWTQDGIQPGDPTDTNTAQDYVNAQKLFCAASNVNPEQITTWGSSAEQNGFEIGSTIIVDPVLTNTTVTEYMWGIASNCERPDKAMDFLNFLYTNAEVANILKYGIEGVNYERVEGTESVIASNGSYNPMFYYGGNVADMYVQTPSDDTYVDQLQALEDAAVISPLCGYMFDDTMFQTEKSVIYTTILEYLPRLQNGMCESEEATLAMIDEFNAKLEASGINDVIVANQEQLDAYLGK